MRTLIAIVVISSHRKKIFTAFFLQGSKYKLVYLEQKCLLSIIGQTGVNLKMTPKIKKSYIYAVYTNITDGEAKYPENGQNKHFRSFGYVF